MMGLPYTLKHGSTSGTPKGQVRTSSSLTIRGSWCCMLSCLTQMHWPQLPVIIHGPNVVADSTFIIKYLQRTYPKAGKKLSDEEAAVCTIVHHFVEKYILFGMFYFRWVQPMVRPACICWI